MPTRVNILDRETGSVLAMRATDADEALAHDPLRYAVAADQAQKDEPLPLIVDRPPRFGGWPDTPGRIAMKREAWERHEQVLDALRVLQPVWPAPPPAPRRSRRRIRP